MSELRTIDERDADVFTRPNRREIREEITEWLEAGKRAQREQLAALEADPKWREMAWRLGGFLGLKPKLKEKSTPTHPAQRAQWSHDQAVKQGWLEPEREPGSDDA